MIRPPYSTVIYTTRRLSRSTNVNTHRPLVAKIPNVPRFDLDRAVGTPDGSESPYHRIAEL